MIIYEGKIINKRTLKGKNTIIYIVKFNESTNMSFKSDMDIDKNSQIIIKHYDNNSTIGRENIVKYNRNIPDYDDVCFKENLKLYINFRLSRYIEKFTKTDVSLNNFTTQEYPEIDYLNLYKKLIVSNTQIPELKEKWEKLLNEINGWIFKKEQPSKDRILILTSTFHEILASPEFLKVFKNPLIEIILDVPKFSKFRLFRSDYFKKPELFRQLSYTMYICEFYLNNHDCNNSDKKYFTINYGFNSTKKIYWKQTQLINLIRNTMIGDKGKMSNKWLNKYNYVKNLNDKIINKNINKLIKQDYLVKSTDNQIYCQHIYSILTNITGFLKSIYKKKNPITFDINHTFLRDLITQQKKILKKKSNIKALEGYPGTGKSYTITRIINYLCEKSNSCLILGPTGISVNNVKNGIESKYIHESFLNKPDIFTIHKQICSPASYSSENHNGEKQLMISKHDVLIIDEAGMIGSKTFSKFIDMCNKHSLTFKMIIFAGDSNQLPPINDCCHTSILEICKKIEYIQRVKLTEIKRSDNENLCKFFKNMANGEITEKDLRENITIIAPHNFQNEYFNDKNIKDICKNKQLWIAPENKITHNINLKCQQKKHKIDFKLDLLNQSLKFKIDNFRENHIHFKSQNGKFKSLILQNDKILNRKNIYEYESVGNLKLVNGDLGMVENIINNDNKLKTMYINVFNGFSEKDNKKFPKFKNIDLEKKDCENIELGYSMTVHKSQGSEAQIVYTIIDYDNINSSYFLNTCGTRNLVYTGFTRAKKKVNLVIKDENIPKLVELIQKKPQELVDIGIDNLV